MTFHDNVASIADQFIHQILCELSDKDLDACRAYINCHPSSSLCPTHDYCDANQVMLAAFQKSMGRVMNVCDDADHKLSCAAWELARSLEFRQEWTDVPQFCEWSESGVEVDDVGSPALVCGPHASECGYSLCEGIAYAEGAFVTKDEHGTYVAPIGNNVIAGTLETCELFLWLHSSRHNASAGGQA